LTEAAAARGSGLRLVAEKPERDRLPLWRHPEWAERFPWLIQGTTGRGEDTEPFDLGVYGSVPTGKLMDRWARLLDATGQRTVIHSRQVHENRVAEWFDPLPPGVLHVSGYDAHVTDRPGVLLSVSIADCVPVFLVAEGSRAVGMVHAGWRGVAASIVERSIESLTARTGESEGSLWLHCGPSICGTCYEVGPEVHAGVRPGEAPPGEAEPIDLRQAIAERATAAGLSLDRITSSSHCTLCGPSDFFSHRGGSKGRQMGVLGRLS
jgi:polyphenol oxidase